MAKFTRTYQTDLKYTEWELIQEYFPPHHRGRPRKWDPWLIINAILYVVRTGCQWRMMPKDLPPGQTATSSSESMTYLASIRRMLKLAAE